MNDTMSLLLASIILAAGGLGLFMYKSSDDKSLDNDYNEDTLFSDDGKENENENEYDEDFIDYEPKQVRSRANKTKRNKKTGGSKRRYY
jgi:hypothetical protein